MAPLATRTVTHSALESWQDQLGVLRLAYHGYSGKRLQIMNDIVKLIVRQEGWVGGVGEGGVGGGGSETEQ